MRTKEDFEPLFKDMTELEFNALVSVAESHALRNKWEFNNSSEIEDLSAEIDDLNDKLKQIKSIVW